MWQNVGIGILALTVVVLGIHAFRPVSPPAASAPLASVSTSSSAKADAPEKAFADWGKATSGLSDTSKPWTLTVLGDSTGNDRNEWVFLTAKWISAENDRPVDIHQWDSTANKYADTRRVGSGSGEPAVIWNHSAPGQTAEYTLDHLKDSTPERPDAVIVNHGHNGGGASRSQVNRLVDAALSRWDNPPALAVTLQNPHTSEATKDQRAKLSADLERNYSDGPVRIIDVRSAFESTNDVAPLLMDDGLHPNPAGSQVWAEAVIQAFG